MTVPPVSKSPRQNGFRRRRAKQLHLVTLRSLRSPIAPEWTPKPRLPPSACVTAPGMAPSPSSIDAVRRRPLHQFPGKAAANAVAHVKEFADVEAARREDRFGRSWPLGLATLVAA